MTEPENPHTPSTRAAGTASWAEQHSFDAKAVEATAQHQPQPTPSFPAGADAATASFAGDPTDPAPRDDLPQIPGFQITGVLGNGGMGTVFKARHLATERVVALKLIKSGWANDNDFRTRFAREVKVLAQLEHPNIVPIYDADTWQGLPYMTMKFVPGKTLYHHLERLRRDPTSAAKLLAKVARAVGYLHAHGIVHRDLKPLNILLTKDDEPLVADFGLVRLTDDDAGMSVSLVPLGTRQYMSPEQTLGGNENYTPACDIWALGITLYELLAGRRPYSHQDTAELYRMIRHDPLPPLPVDVNSPAGLLAIAYRCLAKAPADRYATAEEVAIDLDKWIAGETIPMPPVRQPRRRYRRAVAAVALLALLGFSGIPAAPTQPPRQPDARTVAERVRAGETVWLIGDKGLPVVLNMPGGRVGHVGADKDGYCVVGSAEVGLVELVAPQRLPPCTVEAEVAVSTGISRSRFGVYSGRRDWTSDGAVHQVCFAATVNGPPEVPKKREIPPGRLAVEVMHLHPQDPQLRTAPLAAQVEYEPPPLPFNQPPTWQPLRIRLSSRSVLVNSADRVVDPIATDQLRALSILHLRRVANHPKDLDPLSGGLGLFVAQGAALFRNVRLVPEKP